MQNNIEKIVHVSLHEIIKAQDNNKNIDIETVMLFGAEGILDSMALVSLILLIEEKIQTEFNIDVVLVDEKAMSSHNSPFRNYHSLVKHVAQVLQHD